jgi:hypothetical protein
MQRKSSQEMELPWLLSDATDDRLPESKTAEMLPEPPQWQPAAFCFRLVGITDSRGSNDASENPSASVANPPSTPIQHEKTL